jgi:squalene-hopene/tetraprenyl-beta-curcumene cyclase
MNFLKISIWSIFILQVVMTSSMSFADRNAEASSDVHTLVTDLQSKILASRIDSTYWNMPLTMGTNYVSQYYLLLQWLNQEDAHLNVSRLRQILLSTQLANGSWYNSVDLNKSDGNLDATITNYWTLKVMGLDVSAEPMTKAKDFILQHGGIDKSTLFMKIILALFNNYPWVRIEKIPIFALNENNPQFINLNNFAQWVRPHFVPIAYLGARALSKDLGARFHLEELGAEENRVPQPSPPWTSKARVQPSVLHPSDVAQLQTLAAKLLSTQQPSGSWGGYTSATLFSLVALDDFKINIDPSSAEKIGSAMAKGFQFVDDYYLLKTGDSAYKGSVCDGRYWDSILLLGSLLKSGVESSSLTASADYLVKVQTSSGGIPFGLDFEYAPDTDDTAEMVSTLSLMKGDRYKKSIQHAVSWLATMQNSDGGWGAFDRNNVGNPLLRMFAAPFTDSAELFDKSTADVTGHILEALGESQLASQYPQAIQRAIQFIKNKQDPANGAWFGRWGVNYIYGTSAAVIGLVKVGEDPHQEYIAQALDWLSSRQNSDGGFGETTESYHHSDSAGQGISTPSQTSWAISALVEGGRSDSEVVRKAIQYLLKTWQKDSELRDPSVVGTGHPGIVYLDYPSYPRAFTLNALARYLEKTK